MSSIRRIIASQINGRLSKGPKTEAGKRKSSMNALRHGLLSDTTILANESQPLFNLVIAQHIRHFKPKNPIERAMVEEIACAYWRLRRAQTIETRLLNENMRKQGENKRQFRTEKAFSSLCKSGEFDTLNRYETRLQRGYQRALRNLQNLRGRADFPNLQILPNEPN